MDNETLKAKAIELHQGGMGYIKIAHELDIDRSKVKRLLGKVPPRGEKRFKPAKVHVPLELRLISVLPDTQMRVAIDESVVMEYAEAMREGAEFPSAAVFTDGRQYWLADGFHRYYAAFEAAADTITADIYSGTLRDAQIYAMGANANHGLRRTNADKRHAVEVALADDEWRKLPNTEIARMCAVTESFVRKIKAEHETSENPEPKNSHNARPGDLPEPTSGESETHDESTEPLGMPPLQEEAEQEEAGELKNLRMRRVFHFDQKKKELAVTPTAGKGFIFHDRESLLEFITCLKVHLSDWANREHWDT